MVILQFGEHPQFHNNIVLRYIGLIMLVSGLIVAMWALKLLGIKEASCLNFFEENVPVVKKSLYTYINNPMDYGFWIALIGFALLTGSMYNLIIAGEFIIIMIPHVMLENIRIKSPH
jgi:protein-S-isoprenylcysteine O-methyltransferase Ste14